MPTETLLLFLAASAAVAVVPGPDLLYVVGRGVGQGRKAALVSAAVRWLAMGILVALGLRLAVPDRH